VPVGVGKSTRRTPPLNLVLPERHRVVVGAELDDLLPEIGAGRHQGIPVSQLDIGRLDPRPLGRAEQRVIRNGNDRLREGPHVALAVVRINGYAAESERTFFTASPSMESRRAFRAMEEARGQAFRMNRPGVACGELDAVVNEFLRAEGYAGEECWLHRTGHGFGLGTHEGPWVAEGSTDVLAEGMVVSVERGIYLKGQGGFRHSDTVLVTRDGYECWTKCHSDIESLTILGWRPVTRFKGAMIRRASGLKKKAALESNAVE
jgi:Xaa-Pro dipeptidase